MIPALIVAAVLLIYSRSLRGEFLTDDQAVLDMEELHGKFSGEWSRLTWNVWQGPRALTHLGYRWTWQVSGLAPIGFHAGNVAIHLINIGLVYTLLHMLGLSPDRALLAAAVFGVHPLQVHAVAWISGRAGIQAAMFGYAGVILALQEWLWIEPVLAVAAGYLSMKSKEDGILFLMLIDAILIWRLFA